MGLRHSTLSRRNSLHCIIFGGYFKKYIKSLKIYMIFKVAISLLGIFSKEIIMETRFMIKDVFCYFLFNSEKSETTYMLTIGIG